MLFVHVCDRSNRVILRTCTNARDRRYMKWKIQWLIGSRLSVDSEHLQLMRLCLCHTVCVCVICDVWCMSFSCPWQSTKDRLYHRWAYPSKLRCIEKVGLVATLLVMPRPANHTTKRSQTRHRHCCASTISTFSVISNTSNCLTLALVLRVFMLISWAQLRVMASCTLI